MKKFQPNAMVPVAPKRDAEIERVFSLFDAIAMDIGKDLAFYIETQFPEAVKAASGSFLLSVRNHTFNTIKAAAEARTAEHAAQRLIDHDKHRRTIRRIRRAKSVEEIVAMMEK